MFKRFIASYAYKVIAIVGLIAVAYIGFLKWDNHKLKNQNKELVTQNTQLAADLKSRDTTIRALQTRENEYKQTETEYETILQELKDKTNGPVADVLRHAIDRDIVR